MRKRRPLKIHYVNVDKLKAWLGNPRNNDSAADRLMPLIDKFGFINPIIATPDKTIRAGHTRLKAAIKLGFTQIPVIYVRFASEAEAIAFSIADNKSHEYSTWVKNQLTNLFADFKKMPDFDMSLTGFDLKEIDSYITPDAEAVDRFPQLDDVISREPITKAGELIELGRHKLLCGDALKAADVKKFLARQKPDLLFTDPPYGIDIVQGGSVGAGGQLGFVGAGNIVPVHAYPRIKGDDKPFDPSHLFRFLAHDLIIFGANYFSDKLPRTSCWLVWDKREDVPSNNFADCELMWTSFTGPARLYRHLWSGLLRKGGRAEESVRRVHPTQKPVGLLSRVISDFTKEGALVFDPYVGSGSTILACEKTGRTCYAIEIEPLYCDIARERYAYYMKHHDS